MPHLYVSVRLNDVVVDQRLVVVRDEVWLGSCHGAVVAFPGPALRVVDHGDALQVQGRWLRPGRPATMRRGALEVALEAIPAEPVSRAGEWPLPDVRVLLASAAVVLFGAWIDAVTSFVDRHPGPIAALAETSALRVQPAAAWLGFPEAAPAPHRSVDDAVADEVEGLTCYACTEDRPPVGFVSLE